jgi:hypothetical protein
VERCYRLNTKTLGLKEGLTHLIAFSIPPGSFVRLVESSVNASGLVEAEWDGEKIQIFAADLRARGELVRVMSANGNGR